MLKKLVMGSVGVCMAFLAGCATLPDNLDRTRSVAISNTRDTKLGKALQREERIVAGQSAFYALTTGRDAFAARAALARAAERSIDAQYGVVQDDLAGRLFLALLIEAADRGVRVRLLVDDAAVARRDPELLALDAHPKMEVKVFNPFSRHTPRFSQHIVRHGTVTRRMRNRSFTVDNQATIIGGRNIGNDYFDGRSRVAFGDLDLLSLGPLAAAVSESFDEFWNNVQTFQIARLAEHTPTDEEAGAARQALLQCLDADSTYRAAWRESDIVAALTNGELELLWGRATLFVDRPDKVRKPRTKAQAGLPATVQSLFASARDEVTIFSPCFIPGKTGTDGLCELVTKGVKVRVLTNSLKSDNQPIRHAHYARYRKALLRGGVGLYEAKELPTAEPPEAREEGTPGGQTAPGPHRNTFVIDRRSVFVGAPGFDARSVADNTDLAVQLDSDELADKLAHGFDQSVEQAAYRLCIETNRWGGRSIVWKAGHDAIRREPRSTLWDRITMRLYRVIPVEL